MGRHGEAGSGAGSSRAMSDAMGEERSEAEADAVVSGIACDGLRGGIIRYPIRDDDGTRTR